MMNKQIAGLVVAASVALGIGAGVMADATTSGDPATPSPSPTRTGPVTSSDASVADAPEDLTLAPGSVGPVRAGMSKAQALATGYFVADAPAEVDGCPVKPLTWKDENPLAFDVQTLGNGEITSIGVRAGSAKTAEGLGVGSTLDDVRAVHPDESLVEAGYGQSGVRVFDRQDGGWIGFLFDPSPDTIEGTDRVTFVEVTKGAEPSLMRDGC